MKHLQKAVYYPRHTLERAPTMTCSFWQMFSSNLIVVDTKFNMIQITIKLYSENLKTVSGECTILVLNRPSSIK
jgi:hypothetical protein